MIGYALILFLACKNPNNDDFDSTPSSPLNMSVQTFYPLSKEATIIDVRTAKEFENGHVPNARHVPLDKLSSQISSLSNDPEQAIYFICESGIRSAKAAQLAHRHGYTKAINIKDGTHGWRSAGFPLE